MKNLEKVVILTADSNTGYPVPATKGGAVSELVENIINSNEEKQIFDFTIVSTYDKLAMERSKKYSYTKFYWQKSSKIVNYLDKIIFKLAKLILKERSKSFKSMVSLIQYIFFARKILKDNDYDKVIIENTMLLFWVIRGQKKYREKYYYHAHNLPRTNAFLKKTLLDTSKVLAVSNFVKRRIENGETRFPKIRRERVTVLYNRIDLNHFKVLNNFEVDKFRLKLGISKNDKVVLFAGRISWEKGIDKLIDAVKTLDSSSIKILIVGSVLHGESSVRKNEYVKKLEKKIANLSNKIVFTGYISYEEMPIVYNMADIAVLPSMWEEPAGLTPIEAMACGTPVITTDSGGIPEYVSDAAIVLKRNSDLVNNISKNIGRLLNDKDLYEHYKLKGLKRVKSYSSDEYSEILKEVL